MNLRRVLILADDSADWEVAGLRQLERIALCLDEVASGIVSVVIFWRPDLEASRHWMPEHPRLTKIRFLTAPEDDGYDLVVSTRLFLYRNAIPALIQETLTPVRSPASWNDCFEQMKAGLQARRGAWEFIPARDAIGAIETRFLRGSGKSQDGFVSRYLNRPLSRTITRLLLRLPITPNAWTWLIFPVPAIAAIVMTRGTYWSFVCGLVLFQLFSILDGCDGEIARAKFMESEGGRRLDDFFDVLSNLLLVVGLGLGLRHLHPQFGTIFLAEGIVAAVLIAANEWLLARAPTAATSGNSLGGTLYPRHRVLVERSGLLAFGEKFASLVMQFTKRDVAVLFFVLLALVGLPSLILHLLFAVTAITLALALKARL
jgi:phosphatidylglycerophosphate synthase